MNSPADQRTPLARMFLSPDERRLRAGWRLLSQVVIMLSLALALSIPISIVIGVLAIFAGDLVDLNGPSQMILLAASTVVAFPAAALSVWIARRALDRRAFVSLGLERGGFAVRDLMVGVLIPLPLFALAFVIQWGLGWLTIDGWGWAERGFTLTILGVTLTLLGFFAVGFYEELLFRGYYLQNIRDGAGLPLALFLSSVIFGLAHLGNFSASLASTLGIFGAGYFLAYGWLRTKALWLPIGLHIGWNFFQGPIFGFAVSGTPTPSIVIQTSKGPELFTGGGFGPEAGLMVLPMLALGSILIWLYTRGREPIVDQEPAS